jgi:cytochrome P450
MCLGLHFAYMQAKVIMAHLLPHYEITMPEGYETKFQIMPLIKPIDGLPVTLKAIKDNE